LRIRNNFNKPIPDGRTDIFVWQNYSIIDYATKAFQYAKTAYPDSDLYMNDYNSESNINKLNFFVTLAKELKAANTGIPV